MATTMNRAFGDEPQPRDERGGGVRPLGDVLIELLQQYQARFPDLHVTIVETPATPTCTV